MGKGGYKNIADASDYQFADPTGQFQGQLDQFRNMAQFGRQGMTAHLDPNRAYDAFMGQAPGLAQLAQGPGAQLTQQLNAIAAQQAQEGMQHMGTQFAGQGALHSGAAARAMGHAASQPFADVVAQQQARQAGLTGQLWGQGLSGAQQLQQTGAGLHAGIYGQGMQGAGQMAGQMGTLVAPQYEYQKGGWDRMMDIGQLGLGVASAASGLGWEPFG